MLPTAIRIRHLRVFVAVAHRESVVKAASDLSVTQPAVSKTIKELEAILGVQLLTRDRQGTFLSPFGEIFLRHAETALAAVRQGVEALSDATSPHALPVRVGALPTVSARLLPEAIRRYGAEGLGAIPRIVTGPTAYLTTQLREGGLDIVIGRMGPPDEMAGLVFEHLYSESIVFAVRACHPLLSRNLSLGNMTEFECILPPPGSAIRPVVDRLFVARNLPQPKRIIETVSLAFSRAYMLSGNAIWVISEGVVLPDLQSGVLASIPAVKHDTTGPVGITLKTGLPLSPHAEIFLRHVREVASEIETLGHADKG
ncbi:pca operon transcription factor PcaQ [Fulvimarina sp. MAC3]|uniref:pca operon transcription factor PcaQ n=1 Tax=Fulvimarina sp. MAC3 TaxID=3148887 RepID=UPI0031FC7591